MERDQHTGQQGGGRETTEDEALRVVPEPPGPEQPTVQADAIMSRLPRTRPQRVTGRRVRHQASAGQTAAAVSTPRPPKPASSRTKSRTTAAKKGAAAAPKRASSPARARPATAKRAARRRTPAPAAQPARRQQPPSPTPVTGGAASLPRLAVDGAVEAAKLPLKVGGRLTLRALEAVARGLRNG